MAENHLRKKSNTIFERELCTALQQEGAPMSATGQKRTLELRACTRYETANLCVAVAVVVGPHNSRAEPVGLGPRQGLRVPIDILHADTVGKSAAQSVSAGETVEPLLKRRIGIARRHAHRSGLERPQ